MANVVYLTRDGYSKLKEELDQLRNEERPKAAAAIAEARDKGDVSENAEYDAAKEAQAMLELRISKMETTMANALILDNSSGDTRKTKIISRVRLMNHTAKKEVEYVLVSESEADLKAGKLSIGTPIAKALMGHKKGETIDVQVPAGLVTFEILDITV